MKRFIAVLSSLLVLPAFAEVAPIYYEDIVEYTDDMIDAIDAENVDSVDETSTVETQSTTPRTTINRSTSRAVSAATANSSQRSNTSTRAMASSIRNAQKLSRGTVSRNTKNAKQGPQRTVSRNVAASRTSQTGKPTTARLSVNNATVAAVRGDTSGSSTPVTFLQDSGVAIYNANLAGNATTGTAETARIGVGSRRSTARISTPVPTTPVITEEEISSTTSNLAAVAELTDYCKAQYMSCMDNYCNVLDDNQGRCSCSKNLKNYEKTEQALANATENFKDVVQKIKYIGLNADQVTALFAETEAELTMKSKTDSSQLKNSLDAIKKQIIDASSPTASTSTSNISMDLSGLLNADFTSGFDLSSFLGNWAVTGGSANTVSNQRGETLYKTASQRCKTSVLNSCTAQGIDANLITNSYDLEIDKQCIIYERNLNEANSEMKSNVANASTILQQARLLLMQNKNSYDLRSCVSAIDACMQDEYVCGSDYELCLDPSGKYLSGGEIVKGGTPGVSGGTVANREDITESNINDWTSLGMYELYDTWNYNETTVGPDARPGNSDTKNAGGGGRDENMGRYIDRALEEWENDFDKTSIASGDMATYILQKVGYIDKNDKVHGMCASAMKQCQDYTFKKTGRTNKYLPNNEVIRQYLASTLTKIKLQQDSVLADYAEGCRSDVSSCLSTNGYDETNTQITASRTAVNACRAEIATCMSVGGYKPSDSSALTLRAMSDWVASMLTVCSVNYYLVDNGLGDPPPVSCEPCPSNITVVNTSGTPTGDPVALESGGGQETICHCPDGYTDSDLGSNGHPTKCIKNN